jgi:hypothetical protein
MSDNSNVVLARMIKDAARGSPPSQDDLISLGILLATERRSGSEPAGGPQVAPEVPTPGVMGSVQYSAIRKDVDRQEADGVLTHLRQLMLRHRIVAISVALDPWGQPPNRPVPA